MTIKEGEIVTDDDAHDDINEENDESEEFSEEDLIWTKWRQSYNMLQWRCEENIVEIIQRYFNSCHIEEEWSLMW